MSPPKPHRLYVHTVAIFSQSRHLAPPPKVTHRTSTYFYAESIHGIVLANLLSCQVPYHWCPLYWFVVFRICWPCLWLYLVPCYQWYILLKILYIIVIFSRTSTSRPKNVSLRLLDCTCTYSSVWDWTFTCTSKCT